MQSRAFLIYALSLRLSCNMNKIKIKKIDRRVRSLHQESPSPTPKPTSSAESGPAPAEPHIQAPKPTRPPVVPLWSQVAGKKAKKPAPPPPTKAPHTAPPAATSSSSALPASQAREITHRERRLLIKWDGTLLATSTVTIRDSINTALQATLIQLVVCRPDNNLTLITMETFFFYFFLFNSYSHGSLRLMA